MTNYFPDEMSSDRSRNLARWRRNRDHCAGTDAVKAAGEAYIVRDPDMSTSQFAYFIRGTEYYPAAARTLQSYRGLAFRKPPRLVAPAKIKAREWAITANGRSLEAVAKWAFREYAVTNDGGILVDYTETPTGLTVAQASAFGTGGFFATYPAEAVRKIEYGVVNGRKRLVRVNLMDDDDTARHLTLENGEYAVAIFKRDGGEWKRQSVTLPLRNGKPLDLIPFVHLADDDDGAAMDDLCATNETHYVRKAQLSVAFQHIINPIRVITGLSEDVELSNRAGAVWRFDSSDTKVGYHEYKGDGVPHLVSDTEKLEQHMTALGSQMLVSERAPSEAVEVTARRGASQDSILAAMSSHIARCCEIGLEYMAEWEGLNPDDVVFVLASDFIPASVDPQVLTTLFNMTVAGKVSDRELFDYLQKAELISEAVTYEAHESELEATVIDRPVAAPVTPVGAAVDNADDK